MSYLNEHGINDDSRKKFELTENQQQVRIPIKDELGNLIVTRVRSLNPNSQTKFFYDPPKKGVQLFNKAILSSEIKGVVITEGEIDSIRLMQEGIPAVSATSGALTFPDEFVDLFQGKKVYVCYDIDEAGVKGSINTANKLAKAGIEVYILKLDGLDEYPHGDICDWFNLGKTKDDFISLCRASSKYEYQSSIDPKKKKQTITEVLLEIIFGGGCEIYLDQFNKPTITVPDKPIIGLSIDGSNFKQWLTAQYWVLTNKGLDNNAFSEVKGILEGKAYYENKIVYLHNRSAKVGDVIYYDLGNDKEIIIVDETGWQLVSSSEVKFRRYAHQLEQVKPLPGGQLNKILDFVNLKNESDKLLLLTYLVTVLVPDIPRVLILNTGDQGSAKSTSLRLIRSLIDPSQTELLSPPTDTNELFQIANHNYLLYMDNLSHISEKYSDILSGLVTGIGFAKRKLYTDEEDILFKQKVAIGITGINVVAQKADLLDRCLILNYERIPDELRQDEEEFWSNYEKEKPYLLGALFTVLSEVLKNVKNTKLLSKPRMADYAKYAATAAVSLEFSTELFLSALKENTNRQNQFAIDASVTAQVILKFMQDKNIWEGTSSTLYEQLNKIAVDSNMQMGGAGFPNGSNWLWRKIRQIRPNLLALGINISNSDISKGSLITIIKTKEKVENTSTTSIPNDMQAMQVNTETNDLEVVYLEDEDEFLL